jgi:hypothetical protein
MDEGTIVVSEDHVETCIMYTALIANPATGKSQSLGFFKKSIREIEKYCKTKDDESTLVNGELIIFYYIHVFF